jgi:hypothetical protein
LLVSGGWPERTFLATALSGWTRATDV